MPTTVISNEIIDQYNIKKLDNNGYVYINIRKGMLGLKQAGCIAQDRLIKHLAPFS